MLSKEELLKPRYKVIASWPNSDLPVDLVVTQIGNGKWSDGKDYEFAESELWFKRYPHLFRKLHWSEDRSVEDMPEYVYFKEGHWEGCYKVLKHFYANGWCRVLNKIEVDYPYHTLTPATIEDFNTYIEQLNQPKDGTI